MALSQSPFAETAPALARGQVAIVAGGAATVDAEGHSFGGGARVRVGVGNDQEVGLEGNIAYHDAIQFYDDENEDNSGPYYERIHAGNIAASWKRAFTRHVALIVQAGAIFFADHETENAAADDDGWALLATVGMVASWPLPHGFSIYTGVRFTTEFAVDDGLPIVGQTTALGFTVDVARHLRLFLEAGVHVMEGPNAVDEPFLPVGGAQGAAGISVQL